MRKTTTRAILFIIYTITAGLVVLFFYMPSIQKNEEKNIDKAIVKNLNIDFFDSNIINTTSLNIEQAIVDINDDITALNCYMQTDNVSVLTKYAKIYKNINWIFKESIVKRFHNQCHQEFTSEEIYYNPETKEFFTNQKVNMTIGKSKFVMDGIVIPIKNRKIILGKNLYGQINSKEKCING